MDINQSNKNGNTLLHGATINGKFAYIILKKNVKINSTKFEKKIDEKLKKFQIIWKKNFKELEIKWKNSKKIWKNSLKKLKLFSFLCIGHKQSLKFLIDCGAEVNSKNKHGWISLWLAAWAGNTSTLTSIVQLGTQKIVNFSSQVVIEWSKYWVKMAQTWTRRTFEAFVPCTWQLLKVILPQILYCLQVFNQIPFSSLHRSQ